MADLSASQVRKLGDRLRKSESPSSEDRLLLQQVLLAHEAPMTEVARVLADELGYENTTRLKTEGTLLDKLRREKSNLAKVDDIAGIRLHAVSNRVAQNEVVARIVERFPESEVKDRREKPSHGYRAVHVIVQFDGQRVEVQVRTRLQDAWAQIIERFADSVGRGIRYGEPSSGPVARVVDRASAMANLVNDFEQLETTVLTHDLLEHTVELAPGYESVPALSKIAQGRTVLPLSEALPASREAVEMTLHELRLAAEAVASAVDLDS